MAPATHARKPREKTLREEIRDSGETPVDARQEAARLDREDLGFLGREFLSWLVYHAEVEGGTFAGDGEVPDFSIQFGGRVTLHATSGLVSDMVLKGPAPGLSADLRYAIAGGLSVKEADLLLLLGGQEERGFAFGLSAEHFDLKRVKLPALLTEEEDDRADERLSLLAELDSALNLAFCHFLQLRVSPAWGRSVMPALTKWLKP